MKLGETIMPRRKRSKKWISWLIILILLIAAGVVCYLVWDNYFNDKKDDAVTPTDTSEQVKDEKNGEEEIRTDETNGEESDDKKVKQYEGEDPNKAEELSGVVTYAGVVSNKVMIRANIDQYLETGTCKLNLLKDGQVVYEDTARVVGSAATATCEGFDIPSTKLSNGNYEIIIKIETNEKTGTIRGSINI